MLQLLKWCTFKNHLWNKNWNSHLQLLVYWSHLVGVKGIFDKWTINIKPVCTSSAWGVLVSGCRDGHRLNGSAPSCSLPCLGCCCLPEFCCSQLCANANVIRNRKIVLFVQLCAAAAISPDKKTSKLLKCKFWAKQRQHRTFTTKLHPTLPLSSCFNSLKFVMIYDIREFDIENWQDKLFMAQKV